MSYSKTYNEILEMIGKTVLYTPMARAIVRRAGLFPSAGAGGSGPITALRFQYWNVYGGEALDPSSGESYYSDYYAVPPGALPRVSFANTSMWLEKLSQVRVNAVAYTPHETAYVQVGWIEYGTGTGVERYWPDTGELVYDEFGGANTSGQVYCDLTQTYNTSGWIDFLPDWLEKDVYMQLEARDPASGITPVQLGLCEMQLR